MDGRQARGRVLAQAHGDRIRPIEGDLWFVPSEQRGGYVVSSNACSCPDHTQNGVKCKHMIAVEIVRRTLASAADKPAEAPAAPAPAPPPRPAKPAPPKGDLTTEEQQNIRAALRFLSAHLGSMDSLAKAIRGKAATLRNAASCRRPSAGLAVRLARFAEVPVDDVLNGRFPPVCPTCGQRAIRMPSETRSSI